MIGQVFTVKDVFNSIVYETILVHMFYQGSSNLHMLPSSCRKGLNELIRDTVCKEDFTNIVLDCSLLEIRDTLMNLIVHDLTVRET